MKNVIELSANAETLKPTAEIRGLVAQMKANAWEAIAADSETISLSDHHEMRLDADDISTLRDYSYDHIAFAGSIDNAKEAEEFQENFFVKEEKMIDGVRVLPGRIIDPTERNSALKFTLFQFASFSVLSYRFERLSVEEETSLALAA